MSEWKETDLGFIPFDWSIDFAENFCKKVTDGTHDSPKQKNNGYPLVTSKHIKGVEINFDDTYLISEIDFELDGENGFLNSLKKRILERHHAVIVVAEGAGQKFFNSSQLGKDDSGNQKLGDIGKFLKENSKINDLIVITIKTFIKYEFVLFAH